MRTGYPSVFAYQPEARSFRRRTGVLVAGVLALATATLGLAGPATAAPSTPIATVTTVAASPNAGVGVAGVLLFASVTPTTAVGTVEFTDGATTIAGCGARPVNTSNASFGYASCVTTFPANAAGTHAITATYSGNSANTTSTATTSLPVTATPDLFQYALGLLITFAQNLNVFGLGPNGVEPPPVADTTPPGPVTLLTAAPASRSVGLKWTNPTAPDFAGVIIRRESGPSAPPSATAGAAVAITGVTTSFTDSGLSPASEYSYALFAKDNAGNTSLATTITATTTTEAPSTPPVYNGDFPDPFIVFDGGTYYAFATQDNYGTAIQRLTSTDRLHWAKTASPDALSAVPSWADRAGTWAPEVQRVGDQYVMYYTVHQRNGAECVSIATAASPALQFVDNSSAPLVCQSGGGSIDPSLFVSPTGALYLNWKSNANGAATLLARQLDADGTHFAAEPEAQLLQSKGIGWVASNIESPSMVVSGGQYFLFYSGNVYTSAGYGIGYAVCSGPTGPCTNGSITAPWLGSHGDAVGPGGQSFFTDANGTFLMAYHAWNGVVGYANSGVRAMWIDPVRFTNGIPSLGF